jgi:hypothetical protein
MTDPATLRYKDYRRTREIQEETMEKGGHDGDTTRTRRGHDEETGDGETWGRNKEEQEWERIREKKRERPANKSIYHRAFAGHSQCIHRAILIWHSP